MVVVRLVVTFRRGGEDGGEVGDRGQDADVQEGLPSPPVCSQASHQSTQQHAHKHARRHHALHVHGHPVEVGDDEAWGVAQQGPKDMRSSQAFRCQRKPMLQDTHAPTAISSTESAAFATPQIQVAM